MRSVILFLLFLLPFVLSATIHSGIGEWRADGKAKALYETPLGKLYQLESLRKRPARYMSQAFSEKIRDFLKNYLDSGFQNGGSRESI